MALHIEGNYGAKTEIILVSFSIKRVLSKIKDGFIWIGEVCYGWYLFKDLEIRIHKKDQYRYMFCYLQR